MLKSMSLLKEFKEFSVRGNMIDMAVGVIIGTSFGKVVTSLVNDVLMPPIGFILSGIDFTKLQLKLSSPVSADPITINYGSFISTMINFFIIAVIIFLLIKGVNMLKRNEQLKKVDTKYCGECLMSIPLKATRCRYCTCVQ